jgi:hypothetical protein
MVDKGALIQKMVDNWSIKPVLAEKMVDILQIFYTNFPNPQNSARLT